ncbi:MAG: ABC transporter permease [Ignavibacteriae bacterium]|nr:ABC transporter permease [Ignavibacteria bacterium]MBI3365820.1 ABC transporter permease [Ignavibacteriota bacterium]
MKAVLALIRKEYRLFWSDKVAVSLTFLIPVGLIAIWGSIFGNADAGAKNLRLAFLNQSTSLAAKKIERVLDTTKTFFLVRSNTDENGNEIPFDTASIKDYVKKGRAAAALVIPVDAYTDTSFGMKLKFYYDPKNEMEMQIIQGVLTQTVMSQIPDVFMKGIQQRAVKFLGFDSGAAFNRAIARTVSKYFNVDTNRILSSLNDTTLAFGIASDSGTRSFFKNILDFQSEQLVGKDIANPWATRSVGGWAMMFLMFTLTASAASLFEEKQSGVILRILASPISREHILWSKFLYNVSLGFIQLSALFIFGAIMFKIDIISNLGNLILIVLAAAMACTAFGMLLSAVSATQAQARGLGTFLILAMSSIGGAWFPVSFMPGYIQAVSKATIVYWSMDGFLQVLWRGAPLVDILPNLGILLAIAGLITGISLWQFRKGHVF